MKYMIMMFGGLGAATQHRPPEWIAGMHKLLIEMDTELKELKESGECVASESLVDPGQARTVRFVDAAPLSTDGPFAEVKESLAGRVPWGRHRDQDGAATGRPNSLAAAANSASYVTKPVTTARNGSAVAK